MQAEMPMLVPDAHAWFVLALTVIAVVLFAQDRLPLETSALLILAILVGAFTIFPYTVNGNVLSAENLFLGFGHKALISISALMILGRGLERTGALQPVAYAMAKAWPKFPRLTMLIILVVGGALSAFVNNTPIVVMLLPMLIAVCLATRTQISGVLLPVGLATIVGGMGTTIGTSTNLLVVAISRDLGMRDFGMFDFALPVAIAGSVGILFLWLIAPRILPERQAPLADTSPRLFSASLRIEPGSALDGAPFADALALTSYRMKVERIDRGNDLSVAKLPTATLLAGDRLVVTDFPQNLKEFESQLRATLHSHDSTSDDPVNSEKLAEIVVTSGSLLDNRTLDGSRLGLRYSLTPVAIHKQSIDPDDEQEDLGEVRLMAGDVVLVQGSEESITELKTSGELMVLDGVVDLPRTNQVPVALLTMIGVVAAAATGILPISVAAVGGVVVLLLTRCINWSDATDGLSVPVIMIVVTSLALGTSLIQTGGATFLANLFLSQVDGLPTPVILSLLMLLMSLFTNIISNNAAAIIGAPIAIDIANGMGSNPEAFVLAIIFGSNMSFATPIGYKTNLLVMSAGGYKFSDFLRVGIPLTLIMWISFSLILPKLYEL